MSNSASSSSAITIDTANIDSSSSTTSTPSKINKNYSTSHQTSEEITNNGCFVDEDDVDSLASALSDYNSTFYDAPIIPESALTSSSISSSSVYYANAKKKNSPLRVVVTAESSRPPTLTVTDCNLVEVGGSGSGSDDNRTDEFVDLLSIDDDENDDNNDVNDDDDHVIMSKSGEDEDTLLLAQQTQNHPAVSTNRLDRILIDDDDIDIDQEFENYLKNDEDDDLLKSHQADAKMDKLKRLDKAECTIENYELFRSMAIERYGLLNKRLRRRVWPLLILYRSRYLKNDSSGSECLPMQNMIDESLKKFDKISDDEIKSNVYYNQVCLDVVRTLKRFPPEISDKLRAKLQKQLIDLICKILIKYGHLHYYQGYHDICLTFLLVTGAEQSIPLLEQLTLSHLTYFMETTMESTLKLLFNVMPLIDKLNERVAEHIQKAELGVIFGLSWLITWYSHVMDNLIIILRLYDFFIASHPLMPIYIGAIMITDRADVILSTDCDMASLHTIITKFPTHVTDLEQLEGYIEKALKLFQKYPPESLSELNEKWLDKCKQMQEEKAFLERLEEERQLRQRHTNIKRKNKKSNDDSRRSGSSRYTNNMSLVQQNQFKGRLLFGLTVTVGVAAVAMYAINSKDPQDIFSKFYHLLSYKNF